MIALCFFVLLVGAPPVVQGAHAFGHILALTMPEDVPWCPGFFFLPGDTYVVCGFYSRMIADDNLPSVFMCFLFVIS